MTRRVVGLLTTLLLSSACGPADPLEAVNEHLSKGDLVGGIELLRHLLDENPNDPKVLFLYGRTLSLSGQPGLAEWPLRKAMEDPEWFEVAGMEVAKSELAGRNVDNATEILGQILEKNPDNMEARLLRANAFAASPRHPQDALDEVDRILEINPDEIQAYQPRILAYLTLENEDGANQAFIELGAKIEKEANVDDPTRGWYCATMAIFAGDSGDEELARERWTDCNERFPAHANVVQTSIAFFEEKGEVAHALEIAQAAFEADPSVASGYREVVARYLSALGRTDEAEVLLREAAESNDLTESMNGNLALANHFQDIQDYGAAADALAAGLKIYQSAYGASPELRFRLADLLILAGQDDRALALTHEMNIPAQIAIVRARVAQRRGEYAKALSLYEKAARLWPDNPYAPYHAANAALAMGRFDVALESYRAAIRVSMTATDAPLQAARLSAAQGQWKNAADLLSQQKAKLDEEAGLFWIEIVGHLRGGDAAKLAIQNQLKNHPDMLGAAMAAAAKGVGESQGAKAAWSFLEPAFETELTPDQEVLILRAAVHWAPGKTELSILEPRIRARVEAQPDLALARTIQGTFRLREGEDKTGIASFRAALKIEPEQAEAMLRLADAIAKDQPDEAMDLLDRALATEKESAESPDQPTGASSLYASQLFLVAIARLEETDRAISLLERALEQSPTDGRIALRLGETLERLGGARPRILALADRAIRFRGGEKAKALRERLQAEKFSLE